MNATKDLNTQTELLPLFDYTLNDFSRNILLGILNKPIGSKDEIIIQQDIIKGFINNDAVLSDYSYYRTDFLEVYHFLNEFSFHNNLEKTKWKFRFSRKLRHQTRSKFIQLVLLFRKLYTYYFFTLQLVYYPDGYKKELVWLKEFLEGFQLEFYSQEINENRFGVRKLAALSKHLSSLRSNGHITGFYNRLFLFEAYISISKGIISHKFSFPEFSAQNISLEGLFHPLLLNPVKVNFSSQNNVILITGPNMSGKSVFLKSMAICMHLSSLGLAVPTARAVLPLFDHISVSINNQDDVLNGYSQFMYEIIVLKKLLQEAKSGKKCFAVFDELFKGTSIEDAIEISKATIEGLTHFKNSFFFISTHLHTLQQMNLVKLNKIDTYFISTEVIDGKPVFKYQLTAGWSNLRLGQMLFEMEGLYGLLSPDSTV